MRWQTPSRERLTLPRPGAVPRNCPAPRPRRSPRAHSRPRPRRGSSAARRNGPACPAGDDAGPSAAGWPCGSPAAGKCAAGAAALAATALPARVRIVDLHDALQREPFVPLAHRLQQLVLQLECPAFRGHVSFLYLSSNTLEGRAGPRKGQGPSGERAGGRGTRPSPRTVSGLLPAGPMARLAP